MVKHTQTIRRQVADELFEWFDHFVKLVLKGLKIRAKLFNLHKIFCPSVTFSLPKIYAQIYILLYFLLLLWLILFLTLHRCMLS